MKKIVITGMGAVTPVGIGVEEYWKNIVAGKSGIDTIKSFDPSELAVRFAGEIKSFVPTDYLPKDLVRKTDPFMQYAYIAAEEALRQSGVTVEPERWRQPPLRRTRCPAHLTKRSVRALFPKFSAISPPRISPSTTTCRDRALP